MSDSSFISVQNVSKHFGAVRAVDLVDVDIQRGEFFGLLGPSGCGKTTLLRMLAGFEVPTIGELFIDGQAMSSVPPYHRPVNMVFQNYAIFPHLNVAQNIAFGLRKDRLPKSEVNARVDEALALIKLEGYGMRGAAELSGGQRQRVALARALIKRPKVLLLDEPLGALDKKLREQMQIELRDLQKSVGITFVFVTHDQEEALTMSDRIAVMSQGKVLEVGSPTELYEQPSTQFVAEFLGTMNFCKGVVRAADKDVVYVDSERMGGVRAIQQKTLFSEGDKVVVAIRPENIRISAGHQNPGGNGDVNGMMGTMKNAAYFGDRAHLYVNVKDDPEPVLVTMQNMDGAASTATHGTQSVHLEWSEKSVLLLKS